MRKLLISLGLSLVGLAASAQVAETKDIDPRLGAPFSKRVRATLGSASANVIVIEFSSFRCAHCRSFHEQIFLALRQQYIDSGKVQWVIVNASNDFADQASPVFLAARGALRQGRYWDLFDRFYQVGAGPQQAFEQWLAALPSDCDEGLEGSLKDPTVRASVAADFSDYVDLGLRGTPTFLFRKKGADGRWSRSMIEDLQPLATFQRALDGLLHAP